MDLDLILLFFEENEKVIIPIFIAIIVVSAIILYYFFNTKQKIKRILSKLPDKRISTLRTHEFSRVTGKVLQIREPFVAPYSKRKCVFYQIKIEQDTGDSDNSSWKTLINEERFQEFFLEQNGEYLIVKLTQYPKNFINHLVVDKKTSSGTFKNPNPKFLELLKFYNIKSESYFGFNKSLRYSEAIIELDEQITVAGIAKREILKEPIKGYSYSKIASLESSEKQKLIITDLPKLKSKKRH